MKENYDANLVVQNLKKRGAIRYVCPVCGGTNFAVQGEVATISTTNKINTMNLGTYVPCAMMICNHCGNVQFFALGILDNEVNSNAPQQRQS